MPENVLSFVAAVFWMPSVLALISAAFPTRYGDYTDAACSLLKGNSANALKCLNN